MKVATGVVLNTSEYVINRLIAPFDAEQYIKTGRQLCKQGDPISGIPKVPWARFH